jgi:hypothetical protein
MRIFSGIQPTGRKHLGNYIGAIQQYVAGQDYGDPAIYCVVDMHAVTVDYDPLELRERVYDTTAILIAAGLDPDRCILFRQGDVLEHTELCWLLSSVTELGRLQRMHQFRDKSVAQRQLVSAGLLFYPVLQAADVLAYRAHEVPVGEDQREHLELMRDVAARFNSRFGETLVVPEHRIPAVGARMTPLAARLIALALLPAALALPASAAAAPIPGAGYGGGAVPRGYADRLILRSVFVDAQVSADGSVAAVRVNVYVRCRGGGVLNQRFGDQGTIDATGRLRASGRSTRNRGPGSTQRRPRGRGSVDLVFDGARASGTVRARVTTGARCSSGDRHVELRMATTDVSPTASPTPGAGYFGTVDRAFDGRRTPFAFKVTRSGTRIRAAIFGAGLACGGAKEYLANISPPMKIRADGTFRRVEHFTQRFANAVDRTRVLVSGRFTAQGATGAVSVVQRTRFRNGTRQVCRSGRLGWNALR